MFSTKQDLLWDFCQQKRLFSKADIMKWGLDNFYLRSDRTIRDFVREGRLRRLTQAECQFRNLPTSMGIYEVINDRPN